MNKVEDHYDRSSNSEWNRLLNHRTEFSVTMKGLLDHLPQPPAELIDIGSGPGRYSIELAQNNYHITLVDISQASLALAKEKASEVGVDFIAVIQQNATNLADISDESFDGVLLFGPLYHLITEDQRRNAVLEAKRVLKPGKPIFAAFITRFAPFRNSASEQPDWVINNNEYAHQLLESGRHTEGKEFPDAYFAHPDEVQPLMEDCGFETIKVIGCEGIVAGHEEEVNKLQGLDWETWVDLNYKLGQDPSLFGASDHMLYIGKKSS
ncbi:MAG: class I SAM-dependent methyltransferase [Anaerolineales bacterium]|nr:class I SAM-dependent methyltransferase [Anaerolineales bacterium]